MADITLRPVDGAGPGTHEFLWNLLLEREPYTSISHREMPAMKAHIAFVDAHPYRAWYIIWLRDERIGTVSLTKRNEIGIQIARAHRGKGWGRQAVQRMISLHRPIAAEPSEIPAAFVANVNPENKASIALFESLGARLIQHTYQLPERGAEQDGQTQS